MAERVEETASIAWLPYNSRMSEDKVAPAPSDRIGFPAQCVGMILTRLAEIRTFIRGMVFITTVAHNFTTGIFAHELILTGNGAGANTFEARPHPRSSCAHPK